MCIQKETVRCKTGSAKKKIDITKALFCISEVYSTPNCENGAILEKYYQQKHGEILVIGKENCGHHPHGLEDPEPIIRFLLENKRYKEEKQC